MWPSYRVGGSSCVCDHVSCRVFHGRGVQRRVFFNADQDRPAAVTRVLDVLVYRVVVGFPAAEISFTEITHHVVVAIRDSVVEEARLGQGMRSWGLVRPSQLGTF